MFSFSRETLFWFIFFVVIFVLNLSNDKQFGIPGNII